MSDIEAIELARIDLALGTTGTLPVSVISGAISYDGGSAAPATAQGTATATAAQIIAANTNRRELIIANTGSQTLYVGPSGITTGTGFPIAAGLSLTTRNKAAWYGIVAATTCTWATLDESA